MNSPELAEALRHEDALRRLAWMLHLGGADADDAVQHALTQVALGKRPAGMPLWTFLRAALKHHAFNLRKLAQRRRAREATVGANGTALPVDEMVARDQLRRRVADAVIALAEPYRTTVWLRWFEGLDVDAVASRMVVPANTVRTRLQRAHAQLRLRLDRDYREQWWGVLAAPIGALAGTAPGPLVALPSAAAVLAAALAVCAWLLDALREQEPVPATAASAVASPLPVVHADTPVVQAPLPAMPRTERAAAPPSPVPRLRIVRADGSAAERMPVWWWSADERPTWTERARRGGNREPGTDDAYEQPEPEPTLLRTDARGSIDVPSPVPAAITVLLAPGMWFSAELPARRELVLPATAEVTLRLANVASGVRFAGAHWEAWVACAGSRGEHEVRRVDVDTRSGPGAVRLALPRLRGALREPLVATVLADPKWRWRAEALGHHVELLGDDKPRRAPFTASFHVAGVVPAIFVDVVEPDGVPARVAGRVRLLGDDHQIRCRVLADGSAVFATQRGYGDAPALRVRMFDGREATFAEWQDVPGGRRAVVRLPARATGHRVFADRAAGDAHAIRAVLVENAAGTWTRATSIDERLPGAEVEYCLADDGMWILGLAEGDGRQVVVVTERARVGIGVFSWHQEARLEWLPAHEPVDVRIADLHRDCGQRTGMLATLEFGLRGARGTEWLPLWRHHEAPDLEGYVRPPTWKALTLPKSLAWRARVYRSAHADRTVLLERTSLP